MPAVRRPFVWVTTSLIAVVWLVGTLGSEAIHPHARAIVREVELYRGLDVARGPLDENFENPTPKKADEEPERSKRKPTVSEKSATRPKVDRSRGGPALPSPDAPETSP